jgi:hypothetical protein
MPKRKTEVIESFGEWFAQRNAAGHTQLLEPFIEREMLKQRISAQEA